MFLQHIKWDQNKGSQKEIFGKRYDLFAWGNKRRALIYNVGIILTENQRIKCGKGVTGNAYPFESPDPTLVL